MQGRSNTVTFYNKLIILNNEIPLLLRPQFHVMWGLWRLSKSDFRKIFEFFFSMVLYIFASEHARQFKFSTYVQQTDLSKKYPHVGGIFYLEGILFLATLFIFALGLRPSLMGYTKANFPIGCQ